MAIVILNQQIFDRATSVAAYTVTTFNVPAGTSRLLMQMEYRGESAFGPTVSTVTHNGNAVTTLFDNSGAGDGDINTWWGQRQNPDIGTFTISITFPNICKGLKIWLLALDGEKATGSILGAVQSQRKDLTLPLPTTVGLGMTPTAAESLLLASLAIAQQTTLTTWVGTGFVEPTGGTGSFTTGSDMTATSRYRLNAPVAANTVSATFAVADNDIGGSLIEILAEPVGAIDVTGNLAFGLALTGSVSVVGVPGGGASSARIADVSYRNGAVAWTEFLLLQPDAANVDRRILTAGPAVAPNYVVDMLQTGTAGANLYRWQYRLADGVVTVETGPGTQRTAAHVIALVHLPADPKAYVNGVESVSSRSGENRLGVLDLGTGGLALGGHDQASPAAYTGLIGRYLVYEGAMSPEQVRLLSMSLTDPDAVYGYAAEDDAQVINRSPVAMPLLVQPDGRATMTITPKTIDPDGTQPTISAITQGVHTAVAISGTSGLFLTFERGWSGLDTFDYTVSDGVKASTGKISIDQRRPALLARPDTVSVTAGSSILFDPRLNDVGAGGLRVISVTQGTLGTAVLQADGQIRYTANP